MEVTEVALVLPAGLTGISMCGAGCCDDVLLVMMMGWAWPPSTSSCGWKRTGTDWNDVCWAEELTVVSGC